MTVVVRITGLPDANPNPYVDEVVEEVTQELSYSVGSSVDALWNAGLSPREIEEKLADAIGMTDVAGAVG